MHTGTDSKSSVSDCSGYLQSSLWRGGPLWGAAGGGLALEWGLLSQTKTVESVPEGSIHPPTSCHSSSQNRDQSKRPSTHRRSRLMRVQAEVWWTCWDARFTNVLVTNNLWFPDVLKLSLLSHAEACDVHVQSRDLDKLFSRVPAEGGVYSNTLFPNSTQASEEGTRTETTKITSHTSFSEQGLRFRPRLVF